MPPRGRSPFASAQEDRRRDDLAAVLRAEQRSLIRWRKKAKKIGIIISRMDAEFVPRGGRLQERPEGVEVVHAPLPDSDAPFRGEANIVARLLLHRGEQRVVIPVATHDDRPEWLDRESSGDNPYGFASKSAGKARVRLDKRERRALPFAERVERTRQRSNSSLHPSNPPPGRAAHSQSSRRTCASRGLAQRTRRPRRAPPASHAAP